MPYNEQLTKPLNTLTNNLYFSENAEQGLPIPPVINNYLLDNTGEGLLDNTGEYLVNN